MPIMHDDLFFFEGELPKPTRVEVRDSNGVLDTTISGATISAKTKIDEEAEVSVSCVNNDDGTFDISWPRSPDPSIFIMPTGRDRSTMRIDILEDDGNGDEWLGRLSITVKKRV